MMGEEDTNHDEGAANNTYNDDCLKKVSDEGGWRVTMTTRKYASSSWILKIAAATAILVAAMAAVLATSTFGGFGPSSSNLESPSDPAAASSSSYGGHSFPFVISATFQSDVWNDGSIVQDFDVIGGTRDHHSGDVTAHILIHNMIEVLWMNKIGVEFEVDKEQTQAFQDAIHPEDEDGQEEEDEDEGSANRSNSVGGRIRRALQPGGGKGGGGGGGGSDVPPEYQISSKTYNCYRIVEGTFAVMDEIVASHSNFATIVDIGDTYRKINPNPGVEEGYDMKVLKLTSSVIPSTEKGKLFVVCGLHAREYAPPELCTRFAMYLADNYGIDADVTWTIDYNEIHILPQGNPDGRKITETNRNLYWRKNRNPTNGCAQGDYGVDLNRNIPFKWGEAGSSTDTCSDTYRGSEEASEPEIQAIIDYAETIFPASQKKSATACDSIDNCITSEGLFNSPIDENITGVFLDIHSYGRLLIWPWSWINQQSQNDNELQSMARKLASFNGYTLSGPGTPNFLYVVSGSSSDHYYGHLGTAAFAYELGDNFYESCSTFLNDIVPNNIPSLLYAAVARSPFKTAKGPDVIALTLSAETVPSDTDLTVDVEVSDSLRSTVGGSGFITGNQLIQEVRVFFDEHPYDNPTPTSFLSMSATDGAFDSSTESATLDIPMSGLSIGQHVLYVQAIDNDNYEGPITSKFFSVCTAGSCGGGVVCSDITVRTDCEAEDPACVWTGGYGTNGACVDA